MRNGTVRAIGLGAALLLSATAWAAQAGSAPASASGVLQRQLQRTQAELQRQRTQTDQLRTRVNDLEQHSAAYQAQLEQRDSEIADLQRKLDALSPTTRPAPASSGSH
ncbi:MAG TPA: hypothetical protein VFH52_03625 [Rhodanobacteraceae bacterium]|nr:hypothetical protein [Rhodanobacteraceae bacterium]